MGVSGNAFTKPADLSWIPNERLTRMIWHFRDATADLLAAPSHEFDGDPMHKHHDGDQRHV